MPSGEIAILVGGAVLLVAVCYFLDRMNKRAHQKREADETQLAATEIATIIERSELTGFGVFWSLAFFVGATVSFASGLFSTTVFQQIEANLASIVNLLLLGLSFALLRRRTYKIYRSGSNAPEFRA